MANPFTDDKAYAGQTINPDQIRARELEVQRREQMVEYKGVKLDELKVEASKGKQAPNWPKCKPLIYHDIQHDIPEHGRSLVKRLYFAWMMTIVCVVMNLVGCLAGVIADSTMAISFGISIVILLLGIVVPFIFWYRPIYKAVRNDSGVNFFFFFFSFAWHILLAVIYAVGIPNSGGGGFVVAIQLFKLSTGAGVVLIISGGFWALLATFCILQYIMVIRTYRNRGHTVAGDASKIAKDAASSDSGRAVIAEGAKTAATTAASQYS